MQKYEKILKTQIFDDFFVYLQKFSIVKCMRYFVVILISSIIRVNSCAQELSQAVDLGLSVNWASHNIGACTPFEYGTYLAWAEKEPKNRYWFDTYKYTNDQECEQCLEDLGESICGTEYDMARQLWKGDWRLPTNTEILELRDKCIWEWTQREGINGFTVTGPSGNYIFLPAGGFISCEKNEEFGRMCSYWGGTKSFIRNAHTIWACVDEEDGNVIVKCWGDYRPMGRLTRPVIDKTQSTK